MVESGDGLWVPSFPQARDQRPFNAPLQRDFARDKHALCRANDHDQLARAFKTGSALEFPKFAVDFAPCSCLARLVCSAPNDSFSKRRHSAADFIFNGAGTRCSLTSLKPARVRASRSTPSPPRLNGPGWPGAGGGKLARRRMMG